MEAVINDKLQATAIESQVQLSQSALARVHMIIRLPAGGGPRIDAEELELLIAETVRTWNDKLRDALIEKHGELDGRLLAEKFHNAFPAAYRRRHERRSRARRHSSAQRSHRRHRPDRHAPRRAAKARRFICDCSEPPRRSALSQALPILENMGFMIVSERPYRIAVPGGRPIWLQDFEMQRRDGGTINPATLGERFTDTFSAVWTGRAENDGFNQLIVVTDLTWRQASVLRAYGRYAIQTGASFSQAYMEQVLIVERQDRDHPVAAVRSAVRSGRQTGQAHRLKWIA